MEGKKLRLPDNIRNLDDRDWLNLLIRSVSDRHVDRVEFPGFPSADIQMRFNGSANEQALRGGFAFYVLVKKYAQELGKPLQRESRLLDFGCGWGRILRFFWKDIDEEYLFGCDISQPILETCLTLNVPGKLDLIFPVGKLPYPEKFFDAIIAHSVFSHLPERVHLHWMQEFARVSKPGCVICLTLEPRRFIDFIANISSSADSPWQKGLTRFKPQVQEFYRLFDSGGFVYMPTNANREDTYGDAIVPLSFIEREWSPYFKVHTYIDDPSLYIQAVLVLQRR